MEGKFWQSIHKCRQKNQNILLTGLSGTAKSFTLAELQKNCPGKLLCLVPGEEKAYDLARDLQGLVGEDKVLMFLGREFVL